VQRITSLAERFAPNNEWYVNTLNTVFELGGELVPSETAYNLMRLVAEGTGQDDAADTELRTFAVNTYLRLLEKPSLPDILVQVIGWVLGEYAKLADVDGYSLEDIVDLLCDCIERPFEDISTRGYLVNALMKMVAHGGVKQGSVEGIIRNYRSSRLTDLQQRCYEFEQLWQQPTVMRKVLPYDASAEDIDVKEHLDFLDGFVQRKLNEGAKPYLDISQREENHFGPAAVQEEAKPTLNFTPYELSKPTGGGGGGGYPSADDGYGGSGGGGGGYGGGSEQSAAPAGLNLQKKANAWGPGGYNGPGGGGPEKKEPERSAAPPPPSENSVLFNSSSATQPKAAAASKSAEPAQKTEKELFANSLFAGMGGNTGPASASTGGSKAAWGSSTTAAPKKTPEPARPAAPAAPAPAPAASMDLLDFDMGGSQPAAPASNAAPPAATAAVQDVLGLGNDLLDMDMGAPAPAASAPAPQTASPMDLMESAPAMPAQPLLSPLQVTTAQVGQTWGTLPTERKVPIKTSIANCQELMSRLSGRMNVHPVEIIGQEGIAAGRVFPGNDTCFLHGKLQPGRLDLIIRCRDQGTAQKVADLATQMLA